MNLLKVVLLGTIVSAAAINKNRTKIIGGYVTNIKAFPFQLQLHADNYFCAGSIISEQWAMTAAHCLIDIYKYVFRAGATYLDTGGTIHKGYFKIIHPQYDSTSYDYDIALAKVTPKFPIGNSGVAAVKLPTSEPSVGSAVIISGWGETSLNGDLATQLKAANLNIVSRLVCSVNFGYHITSRMICASSSTSIDCFGDSGGALVKSGTQYGIDSWGTVDCSLNIPSAFTNVAFFRKWIFQQTGV